MPRPRRSSTCALILLATWLAYAERAPASDPNDLPEIALAPRRLETPIEQVAGSVTIIGREEIERKQKRTVAELLEEVPGLNVVQLGGLGKQTSVFTRGSESNHTLVLLDGIEITDPSLPGGSFDYAHLLTQNVERIEVLRGPQSALYGSDAIGGVINIVSRRGGGPPGVETWSEAGAFNTFQHTVGAHGSGRRAHYSFGYSHLRTRGFNTTPDRLDGGDEDNYTNGSLSTRLGWQPTDDLALGLAGHLIDTQNEGDDFAADDPDLDGETRQLFLRGELRHDSFDGRWTQKLGIGLTDHDRNDTDRPNPLDPNSSNTSHSGRRLKLDWQSDLRLSKHHALTAGVETERETVDSRSEFRSKYPSFVSRVNESGRSSAVWMQEQFGFADRLFGSVGVRLDHHDEFGSHTTYRGGIVYLHDTGTKIRGSIATGFKAPGFDELFGAARVGGFPAVVPNADLDPEKSVGWEVGLEQDLLAGRVRLGTTFFRTKIRNLIESVFDPVLFVSSMRNLNRAEIQGFESFLHAQLDERLWIRLDHSYLSAENDETNEDLRRRPKHKITARIEGRPIPETTLSLGAIYIGPRKEMDFTVFPSPRVTRGGYTVVNLAATYDLSSRWTLFGRIDNLFDRKYEDVLTYAAPKFSGYAGVVARF